MFQLLAHTSAAEFLSLTRDKETLFLPVFRPGEGHSLKACGTGQAQTPTTDLQTGADAGATSSLPSIKVMRQGNEEVERRSALSEHPLPTTSLLAVSHFATPRLFSLSLQHILHGCFLSSPFPSSSLRHVVLPSVPRPRLATFPSLHPRLSRAPGARRGAGNPPCLILRLPTPRALNIHDREKHFTANWTHIQLEMEIL